VSKVRYIKGKDGKMLGSVGGAGETVPTAGYHPVSSVKRSANYYSPLPCEAPTNETLRRMAALVRSRTSESTVSAPVERKRPPSLQRGTADWESFAAQHLTKNVPADQSKAANMAHALHYGQTDQLGADYIDHPSRIAKSMLTDPAFRELDSVQKDQAIQAAWLHDTLEDTGLETSDLHAAGFHHKVVEAVKLVTSHKGEPKEAYYARLAEKNSDGTFKEPVARFVKKKDLDDNNQPWRRDTLPGSPTTPVVDGEEDRYTKLGKKYAKAYPAIGYPVPEHLKQFEN